MFVDIMEIGPSGGMFVLKSVFSSWFCGRGSDCGWCLSLVIVSCTGSPLPDEERWKRFLCDNPSVVGGTIVSCGGGGSVEIVGAVFA